MTPFLEELAARRRFGMKPGLTTIAEVCRKLGDPQNAFSPIHVAGTNGKGAVCALLDAVLDGGRYTSPHLVSLNERFFLNGRPIDDARLESAAARVAEVARAIPDLTFFEALTAVAFVVYAEAGARHVVFETGLGGRLDATNVCRPELCVITRIGLDHCDWLGDTVEKIAAEKAGIIKPGVPVVLGRNEPSVRAVVEARAADVGAPFRYAPDLVSESSIPKDFALRGAFNRENAVTALAALETLKEIDPSAVTHTRVERGFRSVVWPGRYEKVRNFIVDGAHNPPAARALAASLAEDGAASLALIAGFCGDKDVDEVLRTLAPFVTRAFAVRTVNPRSLSAEETAARMRAVGLDACACATLDEAIAAVGDAPTLVAGSLFLAGEALVALGAAPGSAARIDPSELLAPEQG